MELIIIMSLYIAACNTNNRIISCTRYNIMVELAMEIIKVYCVWTNMHFGGNATDVTRNCKSVIYYDTPAQRKWVLVNNTWIAIEHPSKSQAFYLPIHTGNVLQSPDIAKFNMAARRPFWKWHCWKSIGSTPKKQVMWHWSLDLIFKAKLKLQSRNRINQDGR